ncbi:hypothetical protein Hanom_Chr14g01246751 [Helianthus anomalus]
MKEVAVELEGLRKFTTHPWVQQKSCNETTSQVFEVEQQDLYDDVPLVSFSTNECESYSATYIAFIQCFFKKFTVILNIFFIFNLSNILLYKIRIKRF